MMLILCFFACICFDKPSWVPLDQYSTFPAHAGASGSTGQMGGTGQTGVTGEWRQYLIMMQILCSPLAYGLTSQVGIRDQTMKIKETIHLWRIGYVNTLNLRPLSAICVKAQVGCYQSSIPNPRPHAGASGSTGQTGGTGQTGVTGEWRPYLVMMMILCSPLAYGVTSRVGCC